MAGAILARLNCIESDNREWLEKHTDTIEYIQDNILPSGSGFDAGCTVDLDKSTGQKIVIKTSFHHMSEYGYYTGWTDHTVIITPSFFGIDLRVTGRNKNDIKDYITEVFHNALDNPLE